MFVVPANTFDNVKGAFPIGFFIWNGQKKEAFAEIEADVFEKDGEFWGKKRLVCEEGKSINLWIKKYDDKKAKQIIGYIENPTPDFQNVKFLCLINEEGTRHNNYYACSQNNLIAGLVYLFRSTLYSCYMVK